MVEIGTFCSQCVFFNSGSCHLGLIDKWKDLGNVKNSSDSETVINRICMYRRELDWKKELSIEDKISRVKSDVYIKGSVIVLCKNNDLSGLDKTLSSLKTVHRIENFFPVVIADNSSTLESVVNVVKKYFKKFKAMISLEDKTTSGMVDQAFRNVKNGFIFVLNASKSFDRDIFDKINMMVNIDLKKFVYLQSKDNDFHQCVFVAAVYKSLGGNKEFGFEEKMSKFDSDKLD